SGADYGRARRHQGGGHHPAMSAVLLQPREARLEPITIERVPAICAIEQAAYTHPWTVANFTDSLAAGYHCQCLVGPTPDDGPTPTSRGVRALWSRAAFRTVDETIIGYFV